MSAFFLLLSFIVIISVDFEPFTMSVMEKKPFALPDCPNIRCFQSFFHFEPSKACNYSHFHIYTEFKLSTKPKHM